MLAPKTVPTHRWLPAIVGTVCICIILLNSLRWLPFLPGSYFPIVYQVTVLTIAAVYIGAWFAIFKKAFNVNTLDLLVTVFVGFNCLNTLILSPTGIFSYHKEINLYLSYLALYALLRVVLPDLNMKTMQLIVGIFGALIISQYWIETIFGQHYALRGVLVNTGMMAGFLSVTIPVVLTNRYYSKQRSSPLSIVYVLLCVITIIAAGSRTAMIALAFTALIYLAFLKTGRRNIFIGIAGLALLTILIIVLYQFGPDSFKGRLLIWKIGTQMIDGGVFTGHGLGFVDHQFNGYQQLYFSASDRPVEEKLLAGDTHSLFNEPYRIFVESGIIGISLYLGVIAIALKYTFDQQVRKEPMLFLGLAILTLLCFGLFSYPLQSIPLTTLFFMLLAMISTFGKYPKQSLPLQVSKNLKLAYIMVCQAIIGLTLLSSINRYKDLKQWYKLKAVSWEYNEAYAWNAYNGLAKKLSNDPAFLSDFGLKLQKHFYYEQAQSLLNQAAQIRPSAYNLLQVGYNYQLMKKPALAECYYKKATQILPKLFTTKYALLQFYEETGQKQKAARVAQVILDSPVKVPSAEVTAIKKQAMMYLKNP